MVRLQAADAARDAQYLWLDGVIEAAEFLGEFTRYRVRVGDVALTADQTHFGGVPQFGRGAPVQLGVQPSQLRFLQN